MPKRHLIPPGNEEAILVTPSFDPALAGALQEYIPGARWNGYGWVIPPGDVEEANRVVAHLTEVEFKTPYLPPLPPDWEWAGPISGVYFLCRNGDDNQPAFLSAVGHEDAYIAVGPEWVDFLYHQADLLQFIVNAMRSLAESIATKDSGRSD